MLKMPKFNLKSPKIRRQSDEQRPLVGSTSSINNPSYSGSRSQRPGSSSSTTSQTSTGPFMTRSPSTNSDLAIDAPIKIRPGMPHGPPSPIIPAVLDIDFDQVPFLFYTRVGDGWKMAFIQSLLIMMLCILCPCLFIFLIYLCVNSMEEQQQQQKGKAEQHRKKVNYFFGGAFILTFTKDMMIVAGALQAVYKTDASTYIVVYAPIMFCWFLFLFALPIALFYFADVQYEFGFDSDRKTLIRSFSATFFSAKTKNQQVQKMEAQDNYFSNNYTLLARVHTAMDEIMFV